MSGLAGSLVTWITCPAPWLNPTVLTPLTVMSQPSVSTTFTSPSRSSSANLSRSAMSVGSPPSCRSSPSGAVSPSVSTFVGSVRRWMTVGGTWLAISSGVW